LVPSNLGTCATALMDPISFPACSAILIVEYAQQFVFWAHNLFVICDSDIPY
jgi:hypothetical protein